MPPPLAYFLTWTCHGTWLHGDERGSVDDAHNMRGAPYLPPDPRRREYETRNVPADPIVLNERSRDIVARAITDHCRIRDWELLALNVRSNHVHLVVACPPEVAPENALAQFKAWCTRRLREAGLAHADARLWTHHGSTRWINDAKSLTGAIAYVLEGQDHPHAPEQA